MQRAIDKTKLKKVLLTRTAIKTNKSESLVEEILDFAHRDAVSQFAAAKRIEISGFGTFYFSQNKAKKRLVKLESMKKAIQKKLEKAITETKITFFNSQIERIDEEREMIKCKIEDE
jgi:nucleoid DNA-binding protein